MDTSAHQAGQTALAAGKPAEACAIFSALTEEDECDVTAWLGCAQASLALGNGAGARVALDVAAELESDSVADLTALLRLRLALGQTAEALACAGLLLLRGAPAEVLLASIRPLASEVAPAQAAALSPRDRRGLAEACNRLGHESMANASLELAERALELAIVAEPDSARALGGLASCLTRRAGFEITVESLPPFRRALALYARAVTQAPDHAESWANLSRLLTNLASRNIPGALAATDSCLIRLSMLGTMPDDCRRILATMLVRRCGALADAVAALRGEWTWNGPEPTLDPLHALVHRLDDVTDRMAALAPAAARGEVESLMGLGALFEGIGQRLQAAGYYMLALRSDPTLVKARETIAATMSAQGMLYGAISMLMGGDGDGTPRLAAVWPLEDGASRSVEAPG